MKSVTSNKFMRHLVIFNNMIGFCIDVKLCENATFKYLTELYLY